MQPLIPELLRMLTVYAGHRPTVGYVAEGQAATVQLPLHMLFVPPLQCVVRTANQILRLLGCLINLAKHALVDSACVDHVFATLERFVEFVDVVVPAISIITNMVRCDSDLLNETPHPQPQHTLVHHTHTPSPLRLGPRALACHADGLRYACLLDSRGQRHPVSTFGPDCIPC